MIQVFTSKDILQSFYMRIRNLHKSSADSDDNDSGNETGDDASREPHDLDTAATIHKIVKNLHIRLSLLESASGACRW
jgi:hypothetical protein